MGYYSIYFIIFIILTNAKQYKEYNPPLGPSCQMATPPPAPCSLFASIVRILMLSIGRMNKFKPFYVHVRANPANPGSETG